MNNSINQLIKGGLMIVLVAFMASCSEIEEQIAPMANSSLKSIPEVLKSLETGVEEENSNVRKSAGNTYATFNAALGKSGLAAVFAENELTVFAPTDAAFAELNLNPGNIGNLEGLTNILLYHVFGSGRVYSSDLMDGPITMAQNGIVTVDTSGPKLIDANDGESFIIGTDVQATNGVVHVIDTVIFP